MGIVESRYRAIRGRIDRAAEAAGRRSEDVVLVGASKRQPVEKLAAAWDDGLRVFGENRVQEALEKAPRLDTRAQWHLIGPLQSNKARRAAEVFSTVHSVDRIKIAHRLDRHAGELGKVLSGMLEVNLGVEPSKHGFAPDAVLGTADTLAELEHLEIQGLMAIPPYEADLERARAWFRRLRELRDELFSRSRWSGRPGFLSMGMSHGFEIAVEEGATHVRVGTALFGPRPDAPAPSAPDA